MKKFHNIEQSQKLFLKQIPAQILSQTIEILGLPILDLEEKIKQEIEENPFLEIDEEKTLTPVISETYLNIDTEKIEETEEKSSEITDTYDISKIKEIETFGKKNYEKPIIENIISEAETLQDHLIFQAKLDIDDERLFTLASYIISELDSDGFFKGDIENLKQIENYTFTEEEIEKVRERIKRYDPVGCGSKNMEEALITQLEVYYPELPQINIIKEIICNDLVLLATEPEKLQEKYNLSEEEIYNIKSIIKSLTPRPGTNFSKPPEFIIPEAIIKKLNDNELDIEYNDSYIPILKVKKEYIIAVKQSKLKDLKEKVNDAKKLILAIEYRKNILRKIIQTIVKHQKDFLLGKQEFLNPLSIEEVAKEVETSLSTVSRAIKDKYILTPLGLLPLKYFFSRSAKSITQQDVSVDKIKKMIKEIIENEGDKPISDEKIANILINKGIQISRRTVTKYREEMGIPPTHKRKK